VVLPARGCLKGEHATAGQMEPALPQASHAPLGSTGEAMPVEGVSLQIEHDRLLILRRDTLTMGR
jgi:hypothetical protein